jgi:hypothetical protein
MAEKVTSVIDKNQVGSETTWLVNQLGELEKKIDSINSKGIKLELNLKGSDTKSLADLIELSQELQTTNTELLDSTKQLAQIRDLNARATLNEAKADQVKSNSSRQASKDANTLSNDYKILSLAQKDAADKSRNYALVLGVNHPLAMQAAQDANTMNNVLKNLDSTTGTFTRNVGNYNDVQGQTNQLLRELPNLAQSPQIFIRALSNNITYFAEAIKKARDEGKTWKDIVGNMGTAAFGLVGIVNLAVTAFIFLSDALLKNSQNAETAKQKYDDLATGIEDVIEAQNKYNDQVENDTDMGANQAKRDLELTKARSDGSKKALQEIADAEKHLSDVQQKANKERIAMYDELQSVFTQLNGSTDETQISDALGNIPNRYRAQFVEQIKKANKEGIDLTQEFINKRSELEEKNKDLDNDRLVAQATATAKANKIRLDDTTAMERRLRDALAAIDLETQKARLETDKKTQEGLIANDKYSWDERTAARYQYYTDDLAILELEKTAELEKNEALHKADLAEINKAKTTQQNKNMLLQLENERYQKAILEANEKYGQLQMQALGKYADESLKDLQDSTTKETETIKANLKSLVDYANSSFHKGQSETRKEYDQQIQAQLQVYQQALAAFEQIGKQISNYIYQPTIQKLEDYKKSIDDTLASDIARINLTSKTEAEALERTGEAQARAALKKADADRQERKAAHDKAVMDKAINIASIIGKTALAVITQYTTGDPYTATVRAAIAAIAGGAELVVAASAQIPGYFTGTDSAKRGLALTGERGQELIVDNDGSVSLTPNKTTLWDFKGGEKVFNAIETKEILNALNFSPFAAFEPQKYNNGAKEITSAIRATSEDTANRIVKAIGKIGIGGSKQDFYQSIVYNKQIKNRR